MKAAADLIRMSVAVWAEGMRILIRAAQGKSQ